MRDDELDHENVQDPGPGEETDWPEGDSTASPEPPAPVATFLLGAVTTLVLVLTWTAITSDSTEPEPAGSDITGTSALAGPGLGDAGPAVAHTRTTTRLSRCASAAQALEGPLGAAQPALGQWSVHIGAMNKLVLGEITLEQASAFWERTRVGAQRKVEDFREEMGTLRQHGLDCPSPELLAPGARALPGCARQVEAEVRLLGRAQRAIDLWEHHVHQMDMLRLGEITPEEATTAWLAMWQQGARDLDAYRSAARTTRPLDDCTRVGSGS